MADKPKNSVFQPKRTTAGSGFSIWERETWFHEVDAVVVGAGLVGMGCALQLRRKHPDWNIVLMDQHPMGGASTRNAGFACFGSVSELLDDWDTLGERAVVDLVDMRWQGLALLRDTLGDAAMGYQASGSVEAFTDAGLFQRCVSQMDRVNEALTPVFGEAPFKLASDPSGLVDVCGAIESPLEGALDTGQTIDAFRQKLRDEGIRVVLGLSLEGLRRESEGWTLETPMGSFLSPRVALATNALSRRWLDVDVHPVANHVLVTQPLPELTLRQTLHHDRGYVYARPVHGRLMIGGGRHWACTDETATLERLLGWARRHVAGAEQSAIDHHWTGHLGIGENRWPVVKQVEDGLWCAVRMGGMGVAIGCAMGKKLADMM